MDPHAAEQLIGANLTHLPIESLPVGQCAGAVLRENIYAERDQPPFDRVAMDGVALASRAVSAGRRRFKVQAIQAAGEAPTALAAEDHCVEIMTGAVLPPGSDTIVPVEQLRREDGYVELAAGVNPAPWDNVHRRASDQPQGALLLEVGNVLHAPEISVAASAGMARVRVSSQPAIVVISTGNELVEPGDPIAPHQIRRSNSYAVSAALRERGFQRVADDHIVDDATELRQRLKRHLETHEVMILSGGISMGKFDLVPSSLEAIGVRCVVKGVAQRPGRPMWFGVSGAGRAVFALPGNPVSTLVCLSRYVMPALYQAMGMPSLPVERVALAAPIPWPKKMTGFIPVRLTYDDWGRPWATPCPTNGSGDFATLAGTHGFVEVPPGPADFNKGFVCRLYRW
ncbi:MAG: molybdopterin molybdotransferase MoeA [Steroidobacteraceae bacterium]